MIGDLTSYQGLNTFMSPNHRMLQVRVIHCPTVCKALVNHHTAIVSDHCMKLSESHADGTPAVLTASIDQAGICCLSLFSTPNDGASPADALPQPSSCSIDLNTIPETNARVPSALVALTDEKAVAVYGEKLFELDVATCLQSGVAGMALDCTSAMPAGEPPPDASAPHGHPYARIHLGIYGNVPYTPRLCAGVRHVYGALPDATCVSLHPQATEAAVGCSDGTLQVVGMRDAYPITSFNTCDASNRGPVLHAAYLRTPSARCTLATATEQANGSLAISTWAVDRVAAAPAEQVVPLDTLELSGDGGAAAGPRRWCVGMHVALGVVLAAEVGGRDIVAFALTDRHRFFHVSRYTVGAPVMGFTVDESSCGRGPEADETGGQLLVRCPEGIELASIDCEKLRPPHEPTVDQAEHGAGANTAAATPRQPPAAAECNGVGEGDEEEDDGLAGGSQGSLTSMLLEAARASAGGGGMGLPSLASLSVPADTPTNDVPPAVDATAAAAALGPGHPVVSSALSEDAAGVAAAVAQAAIENVIDGGAEAASAALQQGFAGDAASEERQGPALSGSARELEEEIAALEAKQAAAEKAAQQAEHKVAVARQLTDVGNDGDATTGQSAGANALVERLLNGNLAGARAAAPLSLGGECAAGAGAVDLGGDGQAGSEDESGAAKARGNAGPDGHSGAAAGGEATMQALEGSVRECYLMCKGIQSTVSRLQHDVGKVHGDVAKVAKAQTAIEKAVRRAEAGVEKVPDAITAAVRGGLESQLKPAVAEKLGAAVAEGFRVAFSDVLVPAFEGAMQTMFAQVRHHARFIGCVDMRGAG